MLASTACPRPYIPSSTSPASPWRREPVLPLHPGRRPAVRPRRRPRGSWKAWAPRRSHAVERPIDAIARRSEPMLDRPSRQRPPAANGLASSGPALVLAGRLPQRDVRPAEVRAVRGERVLRRRHVRPAARAGRRPAADPSGPAARRGIRSHPGRRRRRQGRRRVPVHGRPRRCSSGASERFTIYCSPCHGATGRRPGDGRPARVLAAAALPRQAAPGGRVRRDVLRGPPRGPVGHFFDVITNGYGAMYSYAARVAARDRWAIAAYIRALQLSRDAQGRRAARRGRAREAAERRADERPEATRRRAQFERAPDPGRCVAGGVGLRGRAGRPRRRVAGAFFPAYLVATCSGSGSRWARIAPADAPPPGRRVVGPVDPPAARGRRR